MSAAAFKPSTPTLTDADIERLARRAETREAALIRMDRQTKLGDLFIRMRDAAVWAGEHLRTKPVPAAARDAATEYQLLAFEAYERAHDAAKEAGLVK